MKTVKDPLINHTSIISANISSSDSFTQMYKKIAAKDSHLMDAQKHDIKYHNKIAPLIISKMT